MRKTFRLKQPTVTSLERRDNYHQKLDEMIEIKQRIKHGVPSPYKIFQKPDKSPKLPDIMRLSLLTNYGTRY